MTALGIYLCYSSLYLLCKSFGVIVNCSSVLQTIQYGTNEALTYNTWLTCAPAENAMSCGYTYAATQSTAVQLLSSFHGWLLDLSYARYDYWSKSSAILITSAIL